MKFLIYLLIVVTSLNVSAGCFDQYTFGIFNKTYLYPKTTKTPKTDLITGIPSPDIRFNLEPLVNDSELQLDMIQRTGPRGGTQRAYHFVYSLKNDGAHKSAEVYRGVKKINGKIILGMHKLIGDKASRFFSIEENKTGGWDPDAQELNRAIDEYNSYAKSHGLEEIPLRYYEPSSMDKVSDLEYLFEFSFFGRMPKAANSDERVHDARAHSFLFPPEYIRLARAHGRSLILLEEFLKLNGIDINESMKEKIHEYASNFDIITALTQLHVYYGDTILPPGLIKAYLFEGKSPRQKLIEFIEPFVQKDLKRAFREYLKWLELNEKDLDYTLFTNEPSKVHIERQQIIDRFYGFCKQVKETVEQITNLK